MIRLLRCHDHHAHYTSLYHQQANLQLLLINYVLPFLPLYLFRWMAYRMTSRHSLTYSSIPGPDNEVFVCGKRVSSCRCSVVGHLHPIISIVSYSGNISATLVADRSIPDLDLMSQFFRKATIAMASSFSIPCENKV